MNILNCLSLLFEIIAAIFGIMLAIKTKKIYGWCITLTFVIYAFYDTARFLSLPIDNNILSILFFIASISILWAIWRIYKEFK